MYANEIEILRTLFVSEKEILRRVVEKARRLIGIDEISGKTVITAERSKLRDKDLVYLVVLGRYFSYKLGLSSSDAINTDEVTQESGLRKDIASARLHDLKSEGVIEATSTATWKAVYARAEESIDGILSKVGKVG